MESISMPIDCGTKAPDETNTKNETDKRNIPKNLCAPHTLDYYAMMEPMKPDILLKDHQAYPNPQ